MAERVAIGPDMTAGELHDRLAQLGADLMARALAALERGALRVHAAARGGRHLCEEDRQGRNADRLVEAVDAGARPYPRAVAVSRRLVRARRTRRVKVLAHDAGRGHGAPGTVLDDRLTVACGDGRGAASSRCSAPAQGR